MDSCGFLCGSLAVLGVVTLVGHGIWVALAALGRALRGPALEPSAGHSRRCPGCDNSVSSLAEECPHCGLGRGGRRDGPLRDLGAARRVLGWLAAEEEIDDATADRLLALLDRKKRRLMRQDEPVESAPPAVPPVPVARVVEEAILDVIPVPEPQPERPAIVPPPPVPALAEGVPEPPAKPLGTVLAGFLEERNILWGELVGGLLIVGCSIALVLTLWNSLQHLAYFPFLMFGGITAALFAAGLYTLHHWKLHATSRGLLVIALLLAPLNLLVLADPTARGDAPAVGWLHPVVVAAALLLSGAMVWAAGRDLIGSDLLPGPIDRRWLLALAIVGTAGSQLLTPALLPEGDAVPALGTMLGLAAVPGACYLLTAGAVFGGLALYGRRGPSEPEARARDTETLARASGSEAAPLHAAQAHALFSFLGLAVFALLSALAFLQSRTPRWLDSLPALALPLALAGVPGLACGLWVHRRLGPGDAGTRAAGVAVTLAGLAVMLAGLGLAWPHPLPLLVIAAIDAAALTLAAFRGRAGWLHAGGIPCAALAVLLAVQFALTGEALSAALVPRLLSVPSGATLALLAAGYAGLAVRLDQMRARDHAVAHAAGAVGLGVAALFLATMHGMSAPLFAAGIHGLLSLTALASCAYSARHWLAQAGAWLLLPASLWALEGFAPGSYLVWGIVLAAEGVASSIIAGAFSRRGHPLRVAFQSAGAAFGILALGATFLRVGFPPDRLAALTLALVAAQAFLLAGQAREPVLTGLGSFFVLAALFVLVGRLPADRLPGAAALTLLGHATLAMLVGRVVGSKEEVRAVFAEPLRYSAEATSLIAVPFVLWPGDPLLWRAGYALWASALWMACAWRARSPVWFTLAQAGVSAALLLGVHALLGATGWVGVPSFADPRLWQVYGSALGMLGLVWLALRRVESLRPLWPADANSLERIGTGGLVLGQFLLLVVYIAPGVAAEWYPGFALADTPWWTRGAFALPGWLCVGVLSVLLAAGLRGEGGSTFRVASVGGLGLLAVSAVLLWAGEFGEERATASALRWGLAVVFLAGCVALWERGRVADLASDAGFAIVRVAGVEDPGSLPQAHHSGDASDAFRGLRPQPHSFGGAESAVRLVLGLAGLAVFLLSATAARLGFAGLSLGGPAPDSVFADLGPALSNVGPLALLVLALSGSALRERSAGYASLACLLATLSVTAGYGLSIRAFDFREGLTLLLLAVEAASFGALCWLATGKRIPPGPLLALQSRLGVVALSLLGLMPLAQWLIEPTALPSPDYLVLGSPFGWSALALSFFAGTIHAQRYAPPLRVEILVTAGLLAGVFAGCLALRWDGPGLGVAFGTMTLGWCYLGLAAVGAGCVCWKGTGWPAGFTPRRVGTALAVVGSALAVVALRGADHPWRPWLPAGAALVASAVLGVPAVWFRRGAFGYASGLAVVLAGWLVHLAWGDPTVPAFLLALALSLAVASALWSLPDVRDGVRFSRLASPLSLGLLALAVVGAVASDFAGDPSALSGWLAGGTLLAVGVAFCLERDTPAAGPGFYALLLTAWGLLLHLAAPGAGRMAWAGGLALALHFTLCAALARHFAGYAEKERAWFVPAQLVVAGLVALLAVRACLVPETLAERLTGPLMLLLLVPGGWLLAGSAPRLRGLAPAALAAALASLAWAVPAGLGAGVWLERDAWLLLVLAAVAIAYLECSPAPTAEVAWRSGWQAFREAARPVGQALYALALVAALIVAGQMMPLFDPLTKRTTLSFPGVLAVFAGLVGLIASSLRMALIAGREPLGFSPRGRQVYVYVAELLLLLVFVNARLNVPALFGGGMVKYWPLFVMLLAFLLVGLSELFGRRGLAVLAVPLERTAVFLPLVPILAFWARPTAGMIGLAQDRAPGMVPFLNNLALLPWNFDAHALVWFLAGGVYLTLALLRRSAGWALLSALAANFALWALWAHAGIGFASHPQVWILPLGFIVLVSEYLERDRLSPELAATLRYLGVCLIYAASTAELFLTGLGNSLWLPVVLAVLCVAGVLGGIWLRVKAFLFLGMSFLLLDVMAMIWHAAVDRSHTWVWWASGIVLGMAILALFALFEKRRNDVLRLVDDLRRWD